MLQHAVAVSRGPPEALRDERAMLFPQREDASRRLGGLGADLDDALQEEGEPAFPVSLSRTA